jgi:hypothetical protein
MAYLMLNRKLAAMVPLDAPLQGKNMYIRLGQHPALSGMLSHVRNWEPGGFTGGFATLKIFRQ